MKVMIDLNVMLDFLQRREPFFEDAACVMDMALDGRMQGILPAHGITTLHYFLARGTDKRRVEETMDWLLESFEIASCDKQLLVGAMSLKMADYEDAVVALSAEQTGCTHVITRNMRDLRDSPVPALTPHAFLSLIEE